MKQLVLLLFICAPLFVSSQTKLRGKYNTGPGFWGLVLEFKKDSSFQYSEWSCTYSKSGDGSFSKKGNKLFLHFSHQADSLKKKSNYKIIEQKSNEKDSSLVDLFLTDSNKEPIGFANVLVMDEDHFLYGVTTDITGRASVKVPENGIIKISFIGLKELTIPIPKSSDVKLEATLGEGTFYMSIYDKVYTYRIKSIKKKSFILVDERKESKKRKLHFRKKWK